MIRLFGAVLDGRLYIRLRKILNDDDSEVLHLYFKSTLI
jgi:hypothetical protein